MPAKDETKEAAYANSLANRLAKLYDAIMGLGWVSQAETIEEAVMYIKASACVEKQ